MELLFTVDSFDTWGAQKCITKFDNAETHLNVIGQSSTFIIIRVNFNKSGIEKSGALVEESEWCLIRARDVSESPIDIYSPPRGILQTLRRMIRERKLEF